MEVFDQDPQTLQLDQLPSAMYKADKTNPGVARTYKSGISVISCIKQQTSSSKRSSESEPGETHKKFVYKTEWSCLKVRFLFLMGVRIAIIT